ncbi:hypothetical protein AURDEDRAFT_177769, partial [Auricularia subglabra TFB-10046 SS5]
ITIPSAPASHAHARAHSEGGGQYLGIPSPISFGSHSPVSHSPLSVASSLPSPMPSSSSQFLTVPGFGPSRGPSPEPSVYGSSSTDDDEPRSAMSDSDNDAPMAPFVATRKRLFTFSDGGDDDVIALTGSSPLALSCSPPRTPARSRASSFRSETGPLSAFRFPPSPAFDARDVHIDARAVVHTVLLLQ